MKIDNAVTTMYKEKRIIPYHALVDLINYNKTVKLSMPKYLLLAFCILASISVSAQSKPGSIFGQTKIEKNINGVSISTSIGGVVVEACTVKDTLYTTTVNGVFQRKKVTAGRVVLRFSHISCKDVIKEVERVLERKLASLVNQDYTIVGGIDAIVGILNSVDRGTEKHIMESLEIEEPELADEIRKKMFVFEDILLLDDRAIQRVLRDVENADLELALKNTTEEVQNEIYKNLSKRLAAMIKEDMDFMGPVRMKDVEEAQQKIVAVIRKLEDAGESVISRGGGDDIVV